MLINDASITGSLIVNASASLQNISLGGNIIPDETNLRNLGSTDKYFKEIYVSTGSINFVDGGTIVAVLNSDTLGTLQNNTASANSRLAAIENFTSSLNSTYATDVELNASSSTLQLNIDTKLNSSSFNSFTSSASIRLNALETNSASVDTLNTTQNNRLGSLETISASNISRISSLETKSASVDTLNTTQNTRLTNLENITGSLATTGSNTFIGTQTITGSLFVSANLIVQGTSSLQNITASAVSIGTNIVNLNTANPAIRYAGLVIGDSGSVGGSGSFLYDSVQDEMIFIHRGNSTVVTSSVVLMGPQTFDTIGTETYPTSNIIQKGTGNEHLIDSCIFDNGTTTCVKNNLIGTGTACFSSTITSAGDIVTPTRIAADTYNGYTGGSTPITIQTGGAQSVILGTNTCARLTITSTGVANFACRICTPGALLTSDLQINGTSNGKIVAFSNYSNNNVGLSLYNQAGTEVIYLNGNSGGIGATSFIATCMVLSAFSTNNGLKLNYGNASGEVAAINLMANGTTNGFIGMQMVDGNNGDLWFGSSNNRSMTIYRTGNHGFNVNAPCTKVHVEGGYGARFGCNACFYGGGVSGGGFPYGDQYGNGASYTYQEANTTATNTSLFGGYAAGYFRGGDGNYGGGGAGVVAIGGNGGNPESVNSGGGAGLFARGGKNGAGSVHSYAGWFDGGNVVVRCGVVSIGTTSTSNEANLYLGAQSTIEGGQLVLQKGTSCSCATHLDNYQDSFRVLVGTDTVSTATHFQIEHKTRCATFFGGIRQTAGNGVLVNQKIAGIKAAAGSGTAVSIAYVGHTHSITVRAYARLNDSNGGMITQVFSTSYGSSNAGTSTKASFNQVSDISLAYNNGAGYLIQVTPTYSTGTPDIYYTIEGISHDTMYAL